MGSASSKELVSSLGDPADGFTDAQLDQIWTHFAKRKGDEKSHLSQASFEKFEKKINKYNENKAADTRDRLALLENIFSNGHTMIVKPDAPGELQRPRVTQDKWLRANMTKGHCAEWKALDAEAREKDAKDKNPADCKASDSKTADSKTADSKAAAPALEPAAAQYNPHTAQATPAPEATAITAAGIDVLSTSNEASNVDVKGESHATPAPEATAITAAGIDVLPTSNEASNVDVKGESHGKENIAAAKIQAVQRGRSERKNPESKSNVAKKERKTLEESTAETEELVKEHRAAVDLHANKMRALFEESKQAHEAGDGARAKELSDQAKEEQKRMKEASMNAARAIFAAKNQDQPQGCIDLHGQQVAECLIIVEEQLTAAKAAAWPTLKIITGAGHHSGPGGVKIKPAVHDLLNKGGYSWATDADNVSGGSLTVTF